MIKFYTNSYLERPEHSALLPRIDQPTYRKNAFHIEAYDAGAQIKFSASRATLEGHLACQNSKASTLRVHSAMYVSG